MCCRWAAVSLTLLAVTVAALLSTLELQPPPDSSAATATSAAACARPSERRGARHERSALFSMIVGGEILPVPPAAAQRLKQRRRIGVAAGLSLHQADACLLIGLLGAEQREVTGVAVLPLTLGEIQGGFGGSGGGSRRLEPIGILCERGQGIGHILTGGQNRAAVLRGGLRVGGPGGALVVQQGPSLEDWRREVRPHRPEAGPRGEQLIDGEGGAARGRGQRDVGQAVRNGD